MSTEEKVHIEFIGGALFGSMRGGPLHDYEVVGVDLKPAEATSTAQLVVTLRRGAEADAIATVSVMLDIRDVLKPCASLIDRKAGAVLR